MKITDLNIDGFGVWHGLKLSNVSSRLTAFYGENEAGKTTLMQFVRSVLYGMSPERRKRYLPPHDGGLPGGSLGIVDANQRMRVTRIADRGPDDLGRVTVTTADGKTSGDRLLRDALGDVDEQTFNNIFAIGLGEIQQLGTLSGSKAAESLYRLTSGLDRVSLYDVIQGLRQTRLSLLSSNNADSSSPSSKLVELVANRDKLRVRIEHLSDQNRQWSQRAVRLEELDGEIEEAEEKLAENEHTTRTIEIAVGLKTNWRKRAKLSRQLHQMSGGVQLPDDALQRLDALNRKRENHQREADILQGQRHQLHDETERLGINELLVQNAHRIDALGEQRDWLEALQRQIERLEAEASESEERLASEQNRLSSTLGLTGSNHLREISEADLKNLRPQIQAFHAAQKNVDRDKEELNALTQNERSIQLQLESAIAGGEQHGLPMDVQETSDLVSNLRKRLQVEQRLEQSRAHEIDMQQQSHELLDEQIMPLWLFGLLLSTFVLGALMLGLWLIVPDSPLGKYGGWLAVLGIASAGFSWLFKYFAEDAAAEKLDSCDRQIDIAARQFQEADREKEKLDAQMPMVDGSVVLRLQAAEQHLAELENMLPVETERKIALHEADDAQKRVELSQQKLDAARTQWQSKLAALGLPQEIDPSLFTQVTDRYSKLSDLELQAETRREEVAQRRREHEMLERRITALVEEVGEAGRKAEKPQADDLSSKTQNPKPKTLNSQPLTLLDHLLSERRQQLTRIETRKQLREQAKELKATEGQHRRAVAGLVRRREAIFHSADCEDETAFRHLAEQQQQAVRLRKGRKAISREIAAAIGQHAPEETFVELLRPAVIGELEPLWETATAEQETTQQQLKKLVSHRGEIKQQLRTLAEDRSLAETRLDLSCIEKQLDDARQRWREHATVSRMLERIRADYEAHRQPETLDEASTYLSRLTAGKYGRVWTPLANDILLVETADGDSLPVEALSRGTREQLLLSVRLALVAQMARRGVKLPMVLDDVLVNFDSIRAKRAAEVLKEFAEAGHQLLLFTCHEHMWEMFRETDADCRRLPERGEHRFSDAAERESALPPPEPVVAKEPKPKKKRKQKEKSRQPVEPRLPDPPIAEPEPQAPAYHYPFAEEIVEEVVEDNIEQPKLIETPIPAEEQTYDWAYAHDAADDTPNNDRAIAYIVAGEEPRHHYDHLEPRRA